MSEQPTASATARKPKPGQGRKYAGLTRNQWLITGGVFAAALGIIIWRRRKAAAAANSSSGTGTVNQGSNECTDANGNPVDCNEAFAQELAGLQNSLDQLGAQSGGGAGGSGDTGTVTSTTPSAGDTGTGATGVTQPSGTPTTSTGGTGTATATKAGAISNLSASGETATTAKISWNPAPNASGGYAYKVTQLNGVQVRSGNTKSTSVQLSGLHAGYTYNFGVQALPGGPGNNIHFSTKAS